MSSASQQRRVPLLDEETGDLTVKFQRALAYIFQKYASVPAPQGGSRRIASSSSSRSVSGSGAGPSNLPGADEGVATGDDSGAEAEAAAREREKEEEERLELRSSFGPSSGGRLGAGADTSGSSSSSTAAESGAGLREGGPRRPSKLALAPSTASHPSSSSAASTQSPASLESLPVLGSTPPEGAVLSDAALDRFAFETNGAPFGAESKAEILEFLDVDDEGRLTFEGFLSMYSLQSENDEDETWRDLTTHGFDNNLELVSTRREDTGVDEGHPVPKNRLLGVGMGGPRDENRPDTPVASSAPR